MAAITNPGTKATEFSGEYKMLSLYNLAIASSSEAITLSFNDNGISEIQNVVACVNAGTDADYQSIAAQFSGLVVTLKSQEADGTPADEFTGTTANLIVIGK